MLIIIISQLEAEAKFGGWVCGDNAFSGINRNV